MINQIKREIARKKIVESLKSIEQKQTNNIKSLIQKFKIEIDADRILKEIYG